MRRVIYPYKQPICNAQVVNSRTPSINIRNITLDTLNNMLVKLTDTMDTIMNSRASLHIYF